MVVVTGHDLCMSTDSLRYAWFHRDGFVSFFGVPKIHYCLPYSGIIHVYSVCNKAVVMWEICLL